MTRRSFLSHLIAVAVGGELALDAAARPAAVPATPTPPELLAAAEGLARYMIGLPVSSRPGLLCELKRLDPVLHDLVESKLRRYHALMCGYPLDG